MKKILFAYLLRVGYILAQYPEAFQLPIPPGILPGGSGSGSSSGEDPPGRSHPLDPLTEHEIDITREAINSYSQNDIGVVKGIPIIRQGNSWKYIWITLKEPRKAVLLPYFLNDTNPPNSIPRRSFTILIDRNTGKVYEAIVNLGKREVEVFKEAWPGVQPQITPEEDVEAELIVKTDVEVQERCRRLGWTDMDLVLTIAAPPGYIDDKPEYDGKRISLVFLFGKNFDRDNAFAHPFDFSVTIDLTEGIVLKIEDHPTHNDFTEPNKDGTVVPRRESQWDPELHDSSYFRRDLKHVHVTQDGTSFSKNGNEIEWQKFKFRIGFNGREGPVIYNINYNDGGKVRPLFYRISVVEMLTAYGDPRDPYHRKQFFDQGSYGLGFSSNSLKAQVDCIGEVRFVDGVLNNQNGEAIKRQNVICIHEEDAGILWKHTDARSGRSAVVRNQRLTLTFIATFANYDYIFYWHFHLDGTIEMQVRLTGILLVNLMSLNATPAGHGSVVFPQVNAQYHQHFFSLRIDADIDGYKNSVVMNDVVKGWGETGSAENPYGNGFRVNRTLLKTTGDARTNNHAGKSRIWTIINKHNKHPITGLPVSWKLMPWNAAPLLISDKSPTWRKPAFLKYNTWVMPYREGQIFSAGLYLNNSGLPEWVASNRHASVVDKDIVIFHSLGVKHVPRVEDFPAMPQEWAGVMLKPYNFFMENPALDVPPTENN